ncbi:MAG: M15 family metallopeptidase, partial [Firmicutes bacterium]|nr:M15 family metallopeptidase [Bacillota bacterium]
YTLCVCSGYRTYEYQQELFLQNLESQGEEYTHMFSAYPGRSEHHTGLAIDITSPSMDWALSQDFAEYPEGQWLDEHCQDYGFILRYPKGKEDITGYGYEPWHFRYVGKEVAKEIMSKGITFEEYLGEA